MADRQPGEGVAQRTFIRSAVPSDVPLLLRFIHELADYERLSHEVVADEPMLERFLFDEHPAAEALIAEHDDAPAGFALFFHTFSTFLARPGIYLEDLYVTPKLRGKGIGRALLRYLAELAIQRECGRLEWAVLNWNESAIRFYERVQARPMSEWTVYRLTGDALAHQAGDATGGPHRGD